MRSIWNLAPGTNRIEIVKLDEEIRISIYPVIYDLLTALSLILFPIWIVFVIVVLLNQALGLLGVFSNAQQITLGELVLVSAMTALAIRVFGFEVAWFVFGRELIEIDRSKLRYRNDIFGFGKFSEYQTSLISNLRPTGSDPIKQTRFRSFISRYEWLRSLLPVYDYTVSLEQFSRKGGRISFDVGRPPDADFGSRSFGFDLSEADTKIVIDAITPYLPFAQQGNLPKVSSNS